MAAPVIPDDVYLIVGLLSAWPDLFARAQERLSARFGPVLRESEIVPFDFTDYYSPEMGEDLLRKFLAFERPIPPADLPEIKLWTNDLEKSFAGSEFPVPRPVNIDPGYVTPAKLVLATTKDYGHRIYLDLGICAEVTLTYTKGAFRPMPWTYPDYRTEAYREFFESVRTDILEQERAAPETGDRTT